MRDEEAEAYASTARSEGGGRNLPWADAGAESRTAAVGMPKPGSPATGLRRWGGKPEALRLMEAVVERRRFAHECRLSEVLVRPHGVGFVAGHSATLYFCFMNRRMPNGTSCGVGGRRE
jgi:hypothetical protein